MAIDWGAWEGGSMRMRVGISADAEPVSHGEASCTITVRYYTENNYTWDDDQSLNLGGAIGGSISFHNGSGGAVVHRGTRTEVYSYPSGSYGSSPGNRTFSATLQGAYNGITPSSSTTVKIPARPIGAPDAPTAASASFVDDDQIKVSWNNHPTAGGPYGSIRLQRLNYFNDPNTYFALAVLGGGAEAVNDLSTGANRRYRYRMRAENGAGESGWDYTGDVWTTPATPTNVNLTSVGSNPRVTWVNNVNYSQYETEVWRATNGVWGANPIGTAGAGTVGWTDDAVVNNTATKYKYRVRARTTLGTLIRSSYSAESPETAGVSTPPSAPTSLAPGGEKLIDETAQVVLTWKHNSTDGTPQRQFQIRHRDAATAPGGAWTTTAEVVSGTSNYTLPANTYGKDKRVEWQVMTWGGSFIPSPAGYALMASPWSASSFFTTSPLIAKKYPMYLDVASGQVEADSTRMPLDPAVIDTGWIPLPLNTTDGWKNYGGAYAVAAYRRVNGVVYLKGLVRDGEGGTDIGTLPTGFRPTEQWIFMCNTDEGMPQSAGTTHFHLYGGARVDVEPDGSVRLSGGNWTGIWVSLSNVVFPLPNQANGATVLVGGGGGGGGGAPSGPASGDLAGFYPSPTLASGVVRGSTIATDTINYTHTQGTPASVWTINHPLVFRPNVTVVDSAGRQVEGDVVYTDADTVTITFSGAFAGAAYLS